MENVDFDDIVVLVVAEEDKIFLMLEVGEEVELEVEVEKSIFDVAAKKSFK